MKKLRFLTLLAIASAALTFTACDSNNDEPTPTPGTNIEEVVLEPGATLLGSYANKRVILKEGVYKLKGYVYFASGSEFKIPAGTIIKSDVTEKGAIIIERGAKIIAEGTAAKPIVFTSGKDAGARASGDWGGLIVLGKAKTNKGNEVLIEGGVNRYYGGDDNNDNSGIIKYVRIEFAGVTAFPGSEINGLTLGGVGAGTTIDYVQVSYGNDDAFEIFGGTVNAKHLIAFSTADDDFDFDFGYTGKIQYGIAFRNPAISDTDAGNGVECDNNGEGTSVTPTTRPVLSNFTFVGPGVDNSSNKKHNYGNRWRRAANFVLNNSVMLNWMKGGFSMESAETATSYKNGASEFKNNLVHAITGPYLVDAAAAGVISAADVKAKAEAEGCITYTSATDLKLSEISSLNAPKLLPSAGSPALTGAAFGTSLSDSFFEKVTYRGAIGTTDWTQGWTNFDPINTTY